MVKYGVYHENDPIAEINKRNLIDIIIIFDERFGERLEIW